MGIPHCSSWSGSIHPNVRGFLTKALTRHFGLSRIARTGPRVDSALFFPERQYAFLVDSGRSPVQYFSPLKRFKSTNRCNTQPGVGSVSCKPLGWPKFIQWKEAP